MRVALVTGASTGIGAAAALELARRGYAVGVHYHQSEEAAREVVARIVAAGGQGLPLRADVALKIEVQAAVAALVREYGGLDVVVANAGTPVVRTRLAELSEQDWDRCVDINLKGVFLTVQAALPHLRERRAGSAADVQTPVTGGAAGGQASRGPASIVLVGSAAVYTGGTESGHYAAAKAGVHALVRPLAKELAPDIAVNCVAPGFVDTPFHDKFHVPGRRAKTIESTPQKRAGTAEDLAQWIAFVAEAPFVTGQVFDVNGGIVMR